MEEIKSETLEMIPPPKLTSSWPITRGTLSDTLTCESSISAVDSDLTDRKPPLILHRTSPDSSPCEITILFSQRHEIRQVYVRSTARVYEIYYAVDERGDNEYLCTVRCGAAVKNEELAEEIDGAASLSMSLSSSNRSSCKGCTRSESGGSTNEDGWVDVKMQNPSMLGAKDSYIPKKDDNSLERSIQDYFEATAEISDADPVLSVTIRLLSIQSGDNIYIDEIYVFADPVVSADTNSSSITRETSSESATMSLLIPTLLQMSKFRRNQKEELRDSSVGGRHQDALHESVSAASISANSQTEVAQDTKLNGASAPISQPEFPIQRLDSQNSSNYTSEKNIYSRVERTLDELVSRVARIEHFCLRFEENMLKPISNMEARLERVEQQLESFGKTATLSMTACTKFSAPEFSGIDSESNSIFTAGNDSSGTTKSDSVKKDEGCLHDISVTHSNALSPDVQTNDVSSSCTGVAQLLPSLVITAPDFSSVDDENENDAIEAANNSPKESSKKPVSIDDALASALSGFLLSASIEIGAGEETADISCEESGYDYQSELDKYDDGSNIFVKDVAVKEETFGIDNGVAATESVEDSLIYEDHETENSIGNSSSIVVSFDLDKKDTNGLNIDINSENVHDESNQTCILGSSDCPDNDTSISASGVLADSIELSKGEETAVEYSRVLTNILDFQRHAVVDFAIPILDVKFSSTESLTVKSSLDTLLDVPELSTEFSCVEEDNANSFSEQSDLVMIEKVDSNTSLTPDVQLFCLDNYDSGCMSSNSEEEQQQKCSILDIGASLI